MRLTAERAALADAVKWVSGAVAANPSSPFMRGVRLSVSAGHVLHVVGHDFNALHQATLPVEVDAEGSAVVPAFLLRDLLGLLKGDAVSLEVDGELLTLKAGRSTYRLQTFAEWRDWETPSPLAEGTVDADDLHRILATAAPAADDDNPVSRLRGVRLEAADDELTAVGLRTSSLAIGTAAWKGAALSVALPARDLAEAARGLSGEVTVRTFDGGVTLVDDSRVVVLRAFETGEVDWRRAVPALGEDVIAVEAELLRAAARRAGVAAEGGPVVLTAADGEVRVSTEAGEEYVEGIGTAEASATYDPSLLADLLGAIPAGPVALTFGAATGSGALPLHLTGEAFHHVLMPRRDR